MAAISQTMEFARRIPFWGYMAVPLALGIVSAALFSSSSFASLFFLIMILLAFGRAIIWTLRALSFLLTAFFAVFVFLVLAANIVSLLG